MQYIVHCTFVFIYAIYNVSCYHYFVIRYFVMRFFWHFFYSYLLLAFYISRYPKLFWEKLVLLYCIISKLTQLSDIYYYSNCRSCQLWLYFSLRMTGYGLLWACNKAVPAKCRDSDTLSYIQFVCFYTPPSSEHLWTKNKINQFIVNYSAECNIIIFKKLQI